jgi:hypothetical protein
MESALEQLAPLVGTWRMETSLGPAAAHAVFEWGLGGRILIQRTEIDVPEAPDAFCVITAEPRTGGFTQHYFDSRGVNRLYVMMFDGGMWTLLRETPDFSSLEFSQRFTGRLEDGGATIRGRWESRPLGAERWEPDFDLTYLKAT